MHTFVANFFRYAATKNYWNWIIFSQVSAKVKGWRFFETVYIMCCDYFLSSCVVSHTFSALCVYSMFGHHPHLLGYLCAKFCFFHNLHCWADHGEKLCCQSLSHTQPGNRTAKRLRFGISNKVVQLLLRQPIKWHNKVHRKKQSVWRSTKVKQKQQNHLQKNP